MKKSIKYKLEKMFYNYYENKKRVDEWLTMSSLPGLVSNYSGIRVSGTPQSPVEKAVLSMYDDNRRALLAVKVVENTLIRYKGEHKDKLIDLYYFKRLKAFTATRRLNISKSTFIRWRDEILNTAEMWAEEFKAI